MQPAHIPSHRDTTSAMDADTFFFLQQTQAMEEDQAEDDWERSVVAGATIVLRAEQDHRMHIECWQRWTSEGLFKLYGRGRAERGSTYSHDGITHVPIRFILCCIVYSRGTYPPNR
jgi:hypothetical protein